MGKAAYTEEMVAKLTFKVMVTTSLVSYGGTAAPSAAISVTVIEFESAESAFRATDTINGQTFACGMKQKALCLNLEKESAA